MPEKRFLSFVFTEGIVLLFLSGLILVIPKITEMSFGFMLYLSFILYGGYKAIVSFLSKNFEGHFILNIINALILLILGLVMFFVSVIDMTTIASILGVYFIISSVSQCAFTCRVQKVFSVWKSGYLISIVHAFIGIILLLFVPTLWISGTFAGLDFLITGILLLNMYFSKKYAE